MNQHFTAIYTTLPATVTNGGGFPGGSNGGEVAAFHTEMAALAVCSFRVLPARLLVLMIALVRFIDEKTRKRPSPKAP